MRYIDAEELIAKIKELNLVTKTYEEQVAFNNALAMVVEVIDSLQQGQPEGMHFTPLYRLIQKIPSKKWNDTVNNYAKKLRDCLIKEGYRKDAEVLQGYISYMNGNNVPMATMDEQEQPEVNFEEILDEWRHDHFNGKRDGHYSGEYLERTSQMDLARYCFELGKNSVTK